MAQEFTVDMTLPVAEAIKKINTLKGLYGVLNAPTGYKMFKFVSVRELKKNPEMLSYSILVQADKKIQSEKKWQMVRAVMPKTQVARLSVRPVIQKFIATV